MDESHSVSALTKRPGPGFFVCFLPVSTPELRAAERSTSLQISFFLFLCELSSPCKLTKLQVIVSKLGRCLTSP